MILNSVATFKALCLMKHAMLTQHVLSHDTKNTVLGVSFDLQIIGISNIYQYIKPQNDGKFSR